tara:strand:+ start:2506 stop:4509 length:2004 start_codon:yes stop_codon:yes gene_type:complete
MCLPIFLFGNINDNCKVISLNYVNSESAVAMLKAMGYSVVDYVQDESDFSFSPKLDTFDDIDSKAPGLTIFKFPYENVGYLDYNSSGESDGSAFEGMASYLGGSSMPDIISGEPPEKIMACYKDGSEPDFRVLLEFIKNKLDVPADQVMIEALVIEINSEELEELGINLYGQGENFTATTPDMSSDLDGSQVLSGLSIEYSDQALIDTEGEVLQSMFNANIEALLNSSSGEILSKPSVMVMDGRQARIQIGQHIPITRTTSGTAYTSEDVEYIPTGIILNIRPRISNDKNDILMQVETIITDPEKLSYGSDGILITPIINNRKVETFISVENNNPFIIGGLISDKKYDSVGGIPILSKLPLIGKVFSHEGKNNIKKEVIIVLTPHIISNENKSFSRVIPQDSHLFDSFGNELFPNSYRLKDDDIFDLKFIYESPVVRDVLNMVQNDSYGKFEDLDFKSYRQLKEGVLPGEDILVRRMIYEIIEREKYFEYINPEKVIFPEDGSGIEFLKEKLRDYNIFKSEHFRALALKFVTNDSYDISKPFVRPAFKVDVIDIYDDSKKDFKNLLNQLNQDSGNTILISSPKHLRRLYEVIILKKILILNPDLNLNVKSFKTGLEIIFPSSDALINNDIFIDKDIAQYYYEINSYYEAFENKFNAEINPLINSINE